MRKLNTIMTLLCSVAFLTSTGLSAKNICKKDPSCTQEDAQARYECLNALGLCQKAPAEEAPPAEDDAPEDDAAE